MVAVLAFAEAQVSPLPFPVAALLVSVLRLSAVGSVSFLAASFSASDPFSAVSSAWVEVEKIQAMEMVVPAPSFSIPAGRQMPYRSAVFCIRDVLSSRTCLLLGLSYPEQ